MSELSGERVVGKRRAPTLEIRYECPECGVVLVLDAYEGPPSCSGGGHRAVHLPVFMSALRIAETGDTGV